MGIKSEPMLIQRGEVRYKPFDIVEILRGNGKNLERETGIEPATSSLGSSRSATELLPRKSRSKPMVQQSEGMLKL